MNGRAASSAGSVLAAMASSACCWLPLTLVAVGFSTAGAAAAFFERYRLLFLMAAALLLGVGFYLHYFRRERCAPGESCARPGQRLRRYSGGALWVSTVLVFVFALFPGYVGLLFGAQASTVETAAIASETRTIRIDGMTCAGCEVAVTTALSAVAGVLESSASYEHGTATITIDAGSPPSPMALSIAIAGLGYTLVKHDESRAPDGQVAGQWIATSKTEDGKTFEIVLDLGRVGSRWIGEFDVSAFGVENYPVEVTVSDSRIALHFTAMALDYDGALSDGGARLVGRALQKGEHEDWELIFERSGEVSFSELFLKLEAAADDATAVRSLSSDGRELRAAFNQDTDKVRLLLLLAPS